MGSSSGCSKPSYIQSCSCGGCLVDDGLGKILEKSPCVDQFTDLPDVESSGKNCQELGFSVSEDDGSCYVCETYLPDPSTLVSALKGSRTKQASSRRVTWSPEVYDPTPTEELGGFQFFSMFSGPDS